MTSTTRTRLALVLAGLGVAVPVAALAQSAAPDAAKIARGKYLVTIAGCNDCHTPGGLYGAPDQSRTLAGNDVGWQGPWGVSYGSNLTPDPETGIGRWSEADIVRTLRTGSRPDRTPLLPPMPWPNFARMTDEDLGALAAYLKSQPPVRHRVPARLAPGALVNGPVIPIPPPSAWDAPRRPR